MSIKDTSFIITSPQKTTGREKLLSASSKKNTSKGDDDDIIANRIKSPEWRPHAASSIAETGLGEGFLAELTLKVVYQGGELTGAEIAEELKLTYANVVDKSLDFLKHEKLIEIKGGSSPSALGWRHVVTDKGRLKVLEIFEHDKYIGPAPVTLDNYKYIFSFQGIQNISVGHDEIREAFKKIVISDEMLSRIGPALNSGKSAFLFGKPGNGKTTIAELMRDLLGGEILVPYSIIVDNQVIKLFDQMQHDNVEPLVHKHKDLTKENSGKSEVEFVDRRWVLCKRPMIMVGGELTLLNLDLIYSQESRFYEAPLQLKANGGIFLIDDFGRQQVRPQDLLNRWIVPLEKRVDFLTLHTGKKLEIPFDELILFSTNLEPQDLVDEAFLRRIRYKIFVGDPDLDTLKRIFKKVCENKYVEYDEAMFNYLIEKHYKANNRGFRCCHPRDIVEQIIDYCKYKSIKAELTTETIDFAAQNYFVDL